MSRQRLQKLFQQIQDAQKAILAARNREIVQQSGARQVQQNIPLVEGQIARLKEQRAVVREAIQRVCAMNPDYRLQPFGQGAAEQLDAMFQQFVAITEENIFIASREEQVVICQEIRPLDPEADALQKRRQALRRQVRKLKADTANMQALLRQRDEELAQFL